ncbi:UDP-2,3-diacylglucosamine hydrolase [Microbulbifer donghaiensis]|uniref:UDP-2,3-diacylglucosamine hydrolase n=1 Tax=Microbulbifer donghaiensis TaxID=494016 RepID=A0A1M5IA34_9GAMM|nr:UDP-2,3-diacylglucosamine diphosphatase [Microbulbifer donghaiensis]SHG25234.1 UDP-2,3-diacylglucosamine hydrolase [Microbulbifer donghaiensis]
MSSYLISDLHLDESRPDVTRAFFDFLRGRAAGAEALYILGDFFEVWIGDDDDAPLAAEVARELSRFSGSGAELYLMHGNRDFLLGQDFAHRAGAVLLPDPSTITLAGRKVLLMHGDSLCTRDSEYMAFRQQARDPNWQQALLAKPLEERRAIATQIRAVSKSMNSRKAEDIMDVTPEEVENAMRAEGVHTLIHGHTHRPARHALTVDGAPAERIVLGDWAAQGWCVKADKDSLELIHWPIAS